MGKVIKAVVIGAVEVATGIVLVATGNPVGISLIVSGGLSMAQGVVGLLSTVERKGITGTLASPLASLPIVYGQARLGCRMVELRTVEPNNEYMYWVGAICHGSSDGGGIWSIDNIYFNGNKVWQAAGGWTDPKYTDKVWFRVFYGTKDQTVDSELLDRWPVEWPSTSKGGYVAYLSISFRYDQELFPQGMPAITVDVHGGRCVDPRAIKTITSATPSSGHIDLAVTGHGLQPNDYIRIQRFTPADPGLAIEGFWQVASCPDGDTVRITSGVTGSYVAGSCRIGKSTYSTNPMVCTFEYMTSPLYGPRGGIPWYEMNLAEFATFAAVCDTDVQYSTGAIDWPTHGPQFECNGSVDNALLSDEIIKQLLSSCRGQLVFQNGQWRPFIRRVQTVSNPFVLNEDVIAGGFQLAWPGSDSAPNSMRGRFINTQAFKTVMGTTLQCVPWFADEKIWPRPTTQPNPLLVADNNVPAERQMEYPFTCNPYMLEQIMMAECREGRAGPLVSVTCFEAALACQVGDIVQIIHPTPGWTAASQAYFWVLGMGLRADSLIEMVLMPYADALYTLDALDAHDVPPINTNLPDATGKPPAPTNVQLTCDATTALRLPNGALQQRMKATWTAAANYPYVNHYEFWGYRAGEAPVLLGQALKDDTEFYFPVGHDEVWTVQATTVNTLGITSLPSEAVVLSTPVLNVESTSDNVLTNGDGQQSPVGDVADGWSNVAGALLLVDDAVSKYGDRSLSIESETAQISTNGQTVAANAGEVWEVYGWVNVNGGLGGSGEGAGFSLDTLNASPLTVLDYIGSYIDTGGNSGRCVYVQRQDTSNGFWFLRLIVKVTVTGTLRLLARMGYATGCSGKANFDGVVLHRLAGGLASGAAYAYGTIDAAGNLYVPSTGDFFTGTATGGQSGQRTLTVRYPASQLIDLGGNAAYILFRGHPVGPIGMRTIQTYPLGGGADWQTHVERQYGGHLFLPKGVKITAMKFYGWAQGTNATYDWCKLTLQKDDVSLIALAQTLGNGDDAIVSGSIAGSEVGDQQYTLLGELGIGNAACSEFAWFEIEYTRTLLLKTY